MIENITPPACCTGCSASPCWPGIPLAAVGASYFEIVSVGRWRTPSTASAVCGPAITTSLGLVLGSLAARRRATTGDAAQAAKAIAGGRLDRGSNPPRTRTAQLATAFNDMAAALEGRVERDAQLRPT